MFDVNFQYSEELNELYNVLLFLPKKVKIKKVEKLAATLNMRKKKYVNHIRNLTGALNHRLVLK